jgi:uncharacterized BrkB/YihY/UPF0761 family membrane protein
LVVVTLYGFIGEASLGKRIVGTLHQFPVGQQFNPGPGGKSLHGSVIGLVIGILGLPYGSQGVTQSAQQAMASVWNVPRVDRPGFLARLARSLLGLTVIGGAFVVTAAVGSLVTGGGRSYGLRVPVLVGLLAVNLVFYLASFRVLTPAEVPGRALFPGAVLGVSGSRC